MDFPLSWITPTGRQVRLRPICSDDTERVAAYLSGLSFGTRYFRFGLTGPDLGPQNLARICNPDPAVSCRLVVVTDEAGAEVQIASARFFILADGECCEMEILVADAWQGTRIAHRLFLALSQLARERGLKRMCAKVLPTNARMIKFAQRHGFNLVSDPKARTARTFCLDLAEVPIIPLSHDQAVDI